MKILWKLTLVLMLTALILCGCSKSDSKPAETTETKVTYPYDFTDEDFFYIKDCLNYIPSAPLTGVQSDGSYFGLPTYTDPETGSSFYVMQGGCTDGKYVYLLLEGSNVLIDGVTYAKGHIVFKVDMSNWTVVAQTKPLPLGHGNGMCYNPKLGQLVISYCNDITQTPEDETKMVAFMDVNTMEIVGKKQLDMAIYAIDYNEKRNLYVVGIKGNPAAFAVLDSNFVELGYYPGNNVNLGSQDVDCDDNYIFVGNSGVVSQPGMEVVKVYDWNGEYVGIYRVETVSEQEAIFNYNGIYYITFYTGNGGRVYQIHYDFSLLGDISE